MSKNAIFDFVSGYERPKGSEKSTVKMKKFFSRSYSGRFKNSGQVSAYRKVAGLRSTLTASLSATRTKTYAAFGVCFGLVSIILTAFSGFLGAYAENSVSSLIVGVMFIIVFVPLFFFDKSLSAFLQGNSLTDYILFEFFCLRRVYDDKGKRGVHISVFLILAVALPFLGCLFPLWYVPLAMAVIIYVALAFSSPEFAFFSSFFVLSFVSYIPAPSLAFSLVVGVTVLSLLRKAVLGKRVLNFEQYDFILVLICALGTVSGIVGGEPEALDASVIMTVMAAGYFLASNLITNRRQADCVLNTIAVASVHSAIVAFVQFANFALQNGFVNALKANISSTFSSSDTYAVFLMVAIVFSFALFKRSHTASGALYLLVAFINILALIATGELFALLALIVGALAVKLVQYHRYMVLLLPLFLMLPYAVFLLPGEARDAVFAFIPTSLSADQLREIWSLSLSVLSDHILFGMGIGAENFSVAMEEYGITWANDPNNLFLELGLGAGAVALCLFVLLLVVRAIHRSKYHSYTEKSSMKHLSGAVSVSIFALLTFGATDYIFADMSMFYLFTAVFGMGSAALRSAFGDYNAMVLYYEDTRDFDSSAIDVTVG